MDEVEEDEEDYYDDSDPRHRPFAARLRANTHKHLSEEEKRLLQREGFVLPEGRELTEK